MRRPSDLWWRRRQWRRAQRRWARRRRSGDGGGGLGGGGEGSAAVATMAAVAATMAAAAVACMIRRWRVLRRFALVVVSGRYFFCFPWMQGLLLQQLNAHNPTPRPSELVRGILRRVLYVREKKRVI